LRNRGDHAIASADFAVSRQVSRAVIRLRNAEDGKRRILLRIPKPCGAEHHAVRGQLLEACSHSPLGAALAIACAAHLGWTLLRLAGLRSAPRIELTPRLRWAAAAALAANWIFVALRAAP